MSEIFTVMASHQESVQIQVLSFYNEKQLVKQ